MSHDRVLSQRELNRALLARQLLLERARMPLPRALERVGGIQAQYAPSMYVGLWTRLEGFARDDLTRALERKSVVQATLMRNTIHLVSRRDYWPLAIATRGPRQRSFLNPRRELDARRMAAAARSLRGRLAKGAVPRAELDRLLGDRMVAQGVGQWVDLVRVPPSGTWERRRADLYASAEHWIGPPGGADPDAALDLLVRRYLGAFGPSTRDEIASWAGFQQRDLAPALERLRLRRFRSEDGQELLDLPRAPLPHPDTPAPVRFLPTWDATLLAHARRTGLLPEEHRPKIFHVRNPQSTPTFLVDGAVAGTWRHEDGRVRIEPFGRLDGASRRALREEADRLADLHA